MKKLVFACVAALACLLIVSCSEESDAPLFPEDKISEEMELELSGWKVDSLDKENKVIYVKPAKGWQDSLVLDSLALPGCSALYLAADDDLIDPALGEKLVPGTVISTADTNQVSIVALDSYNRVVGVWLVVWDLPKTPKSSDSRGGASSDAKPESSESSEPASETPSETPTESSSDAALNSSSGESESGEGSSELPGNSSSSEGAIPSSSSEAVQPQKVKLADLSVENGTVTVEGSKVYVEMPYGTDLSNIQLVPLDTANDLIRPVEMEFEDADGNVGTYSVVAGVQLPGSDFSARNDFWATTSDAMATEGSGKAVFTIRMTSAANMVFSDGKMSLTSLVVTGAGDVGLFDIDGGWKLAGGFYYAGTFSGTDCASIYQAENSSAGTDDADFSVYMSYGKPFSARPNSFKVKYSYSHVAGKNTSYPQKSLIYVLLVSAGGKVVATGAIMDETAVENSERVVNLSYGGDPFGLLTGDYPVAAGLELGTGEENVASIHVMFASSAYAHVAAGGILGQAEKNYRGGENSSLTVDDFKLIY